MILQGSHVTYGPLCNKCAWNFFFRYKNIPVYCLLSIILLHTINVKSSARSRFRGGQDILAPSSSFCGKYFVDYIENYWSMTEAEAPLLCSQWAPIMNISGCATVSFDILVGIYRRLGMSANGTTTPLHQIHNV